MDPASLGIGIAATVLQLYTALTNAYDLYLEVRTFPSAYREIRLALLIERQRLELWGSKMLQDRQQKEAERSSQDVALWKLFEGVFRAMMSAFEGSNRTMEEYAQYAGLPKEAKLSDSDLDGLSLSSDATPKSTTTGIGRKLKFILRDKKRLTQLAKDLCYWNDSLDKMTSKLEQESSRRRLRTLLSTDNTEQLHLLQAAAALLSHHDIERMANARTVIQEGYQTEKSKAHHDPMGYDKSKVTAQRRPIDYELEFDHFDFQGAPFMTDKPRTMARYHQEIVLVDWRSCQDMTWRKENPVAFQSRTENLARILNGDLRPLNLAVLHCVGYIDRNSNVTGYAFRPPSHVLPGQEPINLHQVLSGTTRPSDVPDLGERFELAKALVSTIFEFHNMGWMHKNLQPKNIVFWPKGDVKNQWNFSEPYLLGFDISRPNHPGEVSEKPVPNTEDDVYRHPAYKGHDPRPFKPPFDMYSLGVILFEVGMWRLVTADHHKGSRPNLQKQISFSDPQFIEKVVTGPVKDLKRYTGMRYQDAVVACLSRHFDTVWDKNGGTDRMQNYQEEVQAKVVDAIAHCNA
ncbi:MAG: hypothetical protein M1833_006161 [Piccolia ochrophora]|nr:MAG: hypothetical protein M1833_006161 [Piccolia ochrophora]